MPVKQITLIRHAKVDIDNNTKITASQMQEWVKNYNQASIDNTLPTKEIITQIKKANYITASTLPRTTDSLKLISITPDEISHLFDEADIPDTNIGFVKLRPKNWLIFLRILMLLGVGKDDKSFVKTKQRAKEASKKLIDLAKLHKNVVHMGHGGLNYLIKKELLSNGWELVRKNGGNDNWGYQVFRQVFIC